MRLCKELQADAGGKPFPLAVRVIERELHIPIATASFWMRLFCDDGILEPASVGKLSTRLASTYRYVADRPGSKQSEGIDVSGIVAALDRIVVANGGQR